MTVSDWYGDWFDYVLEWERVMQTQTDVPIFTSVYEDLKKVRRQYITFFINIFLVLHLELDLAASGGNILLNIFSGRFLLLVDL